jgi:hypothetical protein
MDGRAGAEPSVATAQRRVSDDANDNGRTTRLRPAHARALFGLEFHQSLVVEPESGCTSTPDRPAPVRSFSFLARLLCFDTMSVVAISFSAQMA